MNGIIVHINGWPGAGKYSVGRLAAARLGARLVPNHAINGPGFALADFGTPAFRDIVRQVRALVFDGIAAAPAPAHTVLTAVLIDEPADVALYDRIAGLASRHGCPFLSVTLDCALEQNCARPMISYRRAATPTSRSTARSGRRMKMRCESWRRQKGCWPQRPRAEPAPLAM